MTLQPYAPPPYALTLTQPWASLIARGYKRIETRSWITAWRGIVYIHAALGMAPSDVLIWNHQVAEMRLPEGPIPRGQILARARIVYVETTDALVPQISMLEAMLGDYSARRYGWVLDDIEALDVPVAVPGRLGLWRVSLDVAAQLEAATYTPVLQRR